MNLSLSESTFGVMWLIESLMVLKRIHPSPSLLPLYSSIIIITAHLLDKQSMVLYTVQLSFMVSKKKLPRLNKQSH